MFPLPVHTVELVLQYISPLTDPLPQHLISTPLRQRHHFLQISASSPVDYLCWPSPDSAKVIDLLDHLPPPFDQTCYPTRYTSDPDSTLAHVQISSIAQGLRMLFHWDDTQAWKYHDLRLMPFPSSSFSTPQESLARAGPPPHSSIDLVADQIKNDSDDSYWDSYGAGGDVLTSSLPRNASKPDLVGEDAYWAQYASVQGSADSTVPSPLQTNRKLRPPNSNDVELVFPLPPQNDPIIDVPVDVIRPHTRLGPPSPDMLAHLLSTISPKDDIHIPEDPPSSISSTDPSPEQTTADPELLTPPFPNDYLDAAVVAPAAVQDDEVTFFESHPSPFHQTDRALTESIRGLYHLWKSGRKGKPGEKDRNVFLQIVQEAVAYE